MKRALRSLCLLLLALGGFACQRLSAPHLVSLTGVESERLSEGDRLEIKGSGFPEGRPARVTLRGELYRPGRPVERGFSVALPAQSSSPHAVTVDLTRELERLFTGPERVHTTFRGSVEVAFFPSRTSSPPVTGGLPELVLDFVPLARPIVEQDQAEAARFVDFSGLLLGEDSTALFVEGVLPGSPAEHARVTKGDELVALGGLRLVERADLIPPPGVKRVALIVKRSSQVSAVPLVLDVQGFYRLSSADLAPAAAMVLALVALGLFLRSPLGRALSFLERRLVERLRSAREKRGAWPRAGARASHEERGTAWPSLPLLLALSCAAAVFTWLAMGRSLIAREIDGAVLLAASGTSLAVTTLLFSVPGERRALARLGRASFAAGRTMFIASVLAVPSLTSGGFGLDTLALEQGAWPWQWHACGDPLALGAFAALVASLVPDGATAKDGVLGPAADNGRGSRRALEIASLVHTFVISGLASFAFLGATRLPGVLPTGAVPPWVLVAGALVLLVKAGALVLLVVGLRRVLGRVGFADAAGLSLRVLWPFGLAMLGASVLLQRLGAAFDDSAAPGFLGIACFAGAFGVALLVARRVAVAVAVGGDAEPGVNPWI